MNNNTTTKSLLLVRWTVVGGVVAWTTGTVIMNAMLQRQSMKITISSLGIS
jgi:hypothetical protein